MKIGWLLTLAGLVIIFAASSSAQQNDATDPQIAQQIRALTLQYEEALNEHDAKAAPRSSPRMQSGRRHREHFMVALRLSEGSQITIFIGGMSRTRSLLSIG
jgi:hypothetical protein